MERFSFSEGQVGTILYWDLALLGCIFLEVRQTRLYVYEHESGGNSETDAIEDQTAGLWPVSWVSLSGKPEPGVSDTGSKNQGLKPWVVLELRALLVSGSLELGIYFPIQLRSQNYETVLCPQATGGTGLSGTPDSMALCPTSELDLLQQNRQREKGLSWP